MENLSVPTHKHNRAVSSENVSSHLDKEAVGSKDHRPANTVSMYVGIGKQKIMPKTANNFALSSTSKRSESIHIQKTQHRSLLRYRKLDGPANDTIFSAMDPLK